LAAGVDAKTVINGRREIGGADAVLGGIAGVRIGGAVNAPTADATAREQRRIAVRPVVATIGPSPVGTAAGADSWGTAKFPNPGNDGFIEQSARIKIFQERRHCLIGDGQQLILEPGEIAVVRV